MRILGADGLTSGANALNKIPHAYLSDGDLCIAKYPPTGVVDNVLYYYQLDADHGGVQNIPYVVVPEDNAVSPTAKRWVLIYMGTDLDLLANTLSQATTGTPLVINGTLSFDGTTPTFTNLGAGVPPFAVNSQVLVDNLNAEYLNGESIDSIFDSLGYSESVTIPSGVDTLTVSFAVPRSTAIYAIFINITNTVDPAPSIYSYMVTNQTIYGFTLDLSSTTDSANYILQYMTKEESVSSYETLTATLSAGVYDNIVDVYNNQIIVL